MLGLGKQVSRDKTGVARPVSHHEHLGRPGEHVHGYSLPVHKALCH